MAWSFEVPMLDGSTYKVSRLLGKGSSNTKLAKSEKTGKPIQTYGLSLAPSKASGFNLCPNASGGCIKSCIYKTGRAHIFPRTIQPSRIAKARMLRLFPTEFKSRLETELRSAVRRANKLNAELFIRLNVFSDVAWEVEFPEIFNLFPSIVFYDYTKSFSRMMDYINGNFPANYSLTFSRSENNWSDCLKVLAAGGNVAVPFHIKRTQPKPATFEGFRVIDGDKTDLRPLDERPCIVGLSAKGPSAIADYKTGFIVGVPALAVIQ